MDLTHFETYMRSLSGMPKDPTREEITAYDRFNELKGMLETTRSKVCRDTVKIAMICQGAYIQVSQSYRKSVSTQHPLAKRALDVLLHYASEANKIGKYCSKVSENIDWAKSRRDSDSVMEWEKMAIVKYIAILQIAEGAMINSDDSEGLAIFKRARIQVTSDYKDDKILGVGSDHAKYFSEHAPESPRRKSENWRDRTDSRFNPVAESQRRRKYDTDKDSGRGREHLS